MADKEFDELLEQSSLGSPGARQLRARVSRDQVAVTRRIADLRNQMMHAADWPVRARARDMLIQLLRENSYEASAEGERQDGERQAIQLADRLRALATTDPDRAQDLTDSLIVALDQATDGLVTEHIDKAAHPRKQGDQWVNKVEGNQRTSTTAPTKAEAQAAGREMAIDYGVEHYVHKQDGTIAERNT